jgi:predicted Zn finger-like uncharacterized protein
MIIQCPKCETQYRFDDSLMGEDGVWVRCTRCQNVFFHPQTVARKLGESTEIPSVRITDAKRAPEDRSPQEYDKGQVIQGMNDTEPQRVSETFSEGSEPSVDFIKESSLSPKNGKEKEVEKEETLPRQQKRKRRWGRIILAIVAGCLFIVIAVGAVVCALYPDMRNSAIRYVKPYLQSIPALEKFFPEEKKDLNVSLDYLIIKDLRQRTVTNLVAGSLQVIEGIASNNADYPVSGVKIRLVLSDPYDAVLGQKMVYCGNILTDEELGAMTEPEIQKELSNPQGSDFPSGRILPKGEIPFMLVFTQDQTAGAIKTTVTVAGADRAL